MKAVLLAATLLWTSSVGATTPEAIGWDDVQTVLSNRTLAPSWRDKLGRSPAYYHLLYGAEQRALEYLRALEKSTAHFEGNVRMLDLAAMLDAQLITAELLARGETANALADGERSPLMLAVERDHLEIARMLLQAGASKTYAVGGYTAAHFALLSNSEFAFRLLVDSGLDLRRLRKDTGETNLIFAAISGGSDGGLRFLLRSGFNPNDPRSSGSSPLHVAASSGSVHLIQTLLRSGADPCVRDRNGKFPSDVYIESRARKHHGAPNTEGTPFKNVRC